MSGVIGGAGSKSGVIGQTELDYEEGHYTYALPFASSGSITPRTGYTMLKYIKIGRMCNIFGKIEVDGESSPSGQMRLTLPFTAGTAGDTDATSNASGMTAYFRDHGGSEEHIFIDIFENNAYAQFWTLSHSGSKGTIEQGHVDTSFELYFNISYHTAS